ncbi:transporter [Saitozyma podzolica]|uniref:Transporter n=1 Tax=Saitozyma podzolica TaxID=1890683 RepID=A0A427XMT3_9TREE|nr:transporter [Saitozyma podzolica]
MTLGNVVRTLAYTYDVGLFLTVPPEGVSCSTRIQRVAEAVYAGGMVTGMVLWGLGLCWYILAFAMVVDHVLKNRDFFFLSKFSVGLWAITFAIGVFATATTTLASELHSPAFKVLGTILSVQVALHWLYVSCMTIYKACDGTIFAAPEVASFEGKVTVRWARERKSAEDDRDLEKAHNPRPSVNMP